MLIKQILSEDISGLDWELEMSKIPNGFVVDVGQKDYTWDRIQKNWYSLNKKNNVKEYLKPEVATDLKGNVLKGKDGKPVKTIYGSTWRTVTQAAITNIDAKGDAGPDTGDAIDPKPIADKKEVELGGSKFIFQDSTKTWFNKKTGRPVDRQSEAHEILMGTQGFKSDGVTKLDPPATTKIMKYIQKKFNLPDDFLPANLGVSSKDKARNIGGVIGGATGELIGKYARNPATKLITKMFPFSGSAGNEDELIKQIQSSNTEKGNNGNDDGPTGQSGTSDKEQEELFNVDDTDNQTELDNNFNNSKNKNPDIEPGAQVKHDSYPNKKFKWEKRANGQLNWRDVDSGKIHTVFPNVYKSIIDNLTSEDLEQLNKGENISINNKPLTPGQLFHARLYAVYHQKNK